MVVLDLFKGSGTSSADTPLTDEENNKLDEPTLPTLTVWTWDLKRRLRVSWVLFWSMLEMLDLHVSIFLLCKFSSSSYHLSSQTATKRKGESFVLEYFLTVKVDARLYRPWQFRYWQLSASLYIR